MEENNAAKKIKIDFIIIPLMIVIAGLWTAMLFLVLLPEPKTNFLVNRGNKYYAAGEYERAGQKYLKAMEYVSNRYDVWYRAVLCAQNCEELSEYDVMNMAREAILKQTFEMYSEEDKAYITDIYLLCPEVYSNEFEIAFVLNEGYAHLKQDKSLAPALSDAYLDLGACREEENLEDALKYYIKAAELSDNAETVFDIAGEALDKAICIYAESDRYDEAFELLDAYEKYLDNGAELRIYVQGLKELFEVKNRVLSATYDAMIDYYENSHDSFSVDAVKENKTLNFGMFEKDWEAMLRLDGSEDAEFLAYYDEGCFIWSPEGAADDFTGVGAGIFAYGGDENGENRSYCFYVGEFENGERSGYGINFAKTGETSFYAYEGMFSEGKANGEGINYRSTNYAYTSLMEYKSVTLGTYTDGFEDGQITVYAVTGETPGAFFEGAYMAKAGYAEAADSLLDAYGIEKTEGRTLIAVLTDPSYGYGFYMPYYQTDGVAMTALGY